MKHTADGHETAPDLATDREVDDTAHHAPPQSIETSMPTVVAPTMPPHLTPEAAVVLARIIQALTRDTRHHRAV
jgi:hypothetical protein